MFISKMQVPNDNELLKLVPKTMILNVKVISTDMIMLQLGTRRMTDNVPCLHINTKKFEKSHPGAQLAQVFYTRSTENSKDENPGTCDMRIPSDPTYYDTFHSVACLIISKTTRRNRDLELMPVKAKEKKS